MQAILEGASPDIATSPFEGDVRGVENRMEQNLDLMGPVEEFTEPQREEFLNRTVRRDISNRLGIGTFVDERPENVPDTFDWSKVPLPTQEEIRAAITPDKEQERQAIIEKGLKQLDIVEGWPQKFIKSVAKDVWDAVKFTGMVASGQADPRDPANYGHVVNVALLGLTGSAGSLRSALPKLPKEAFRALEDYTGAAYRDLNRYLAGVPMPEYAVTHLEKFKKTLDEVFKHQAPLPEAETVFRGVPAQTFVNRYPNLNPGDVMTWEAFTSTSRSKRVAKSFAESFDTPGIVFEINVPKGAKTVDVPTTFARHGTSALPESEVLIPRGSKFKIAELDKESRIIRLDMIPPGRRAEGYEVKAMPYKAKEAKNIPTQEPVSPSLRGMSNDEISKKIDNIMDKINKDIKVTDDEKAFLLAVNDDPLPIDILMHEMPKPKSPTTTTTLKEIDKAFSPEVQAQLRAYDEALDMGYTKTFEEFKKSGDIKGFLKAQNTTYGVSKELVDKAMKELEELYPVTQRGAPLKIKDKPLVPSTYNPKMNPNAI